jgi:asparagine synthase (glutamine-hydrolysing)
VSPSSPSLPKGSVVLAGRWRRLATDANDVVHAQHGPGACDDVALSFWLRGACAGRVPVRQGFVACLVRADGSALVVTSSRVEVAIYFTIEDGHLLLATHPRDLISAMAKRPELDLAKLADLMALWDDRETTVFSGVHRLPVGHSLEWRPGLPPRTTRWFRPQDAEPLRIAPSAAPSAMRLAVRGAVEASLPEDGDVASLLSGGLDSSTVVSVTASILAPEGRTTHTMTHVPLDGTADLNAVWEANDWPYVERMIRDVPGLTGRQLVNTELVTPLEFLTASFERTWTPVRNPSTYVWLGRAIGIAEDEGWPLLLTGATGNGPFSRPRAGVLAQMLRERHLWGIVRQVRARHQAGEEWGTAGQGIARELAPDWLRSVRARLRAERAGVPSPDFAHVMPLRWEALSAGGQAHLQRSVGTSASLEQDWRRLVLRDASHALAGQLTSETVWVGDPMSDPEVVTLALRLPTEAWVVSGINRGLAREASRGLVPDYIRLRETRGAQSTDVDLWIRGREEYYRDALDLLRATPGVATFIDLDALETSLDLGMPQGDEARWWDLTHGRAFALGMFAAWYAGTSTVSR